MNDKDTVVRAHQAEALRDNTLLKEFINDMRQTVYNNIESSSRKDTDDREELYKMLKVISSFEHQLRRCINHGKVAQSRLDVFMQKIGI